jgi:hypothetical protein
VLCPPRPEHRFTTSYDEGIAMLQYLDVNTLPTEVVNISANLSSCFLAGVPPQCWSVL